MKFRLFWFECKCRLQVSVERSGPQLEALFREAVETLGDGASLEQQVTGMCPPLPHPHFFSDSGVPWPELLGMRVFRAIVERMAMAELEHALLCCCVLLVTVLESPARIVTFLSSLGASALTDLHAPFTV